MTSPDRPAPDGLGSATDAGYEPAPGEGTRSWVDLPGAATLPLSGS